MIELDSLKRHPDAGGKPGEAVLCDLGARSVIAALPPPTVMMNDSRYGAGIFDRRVFGIDFEHTSLAIVA